jgi:RNA polymerase sigma-70 factor (ECF subfamily)
MIPPSPMDELLAAVPKLRAFAVSLCRNGDHADDLVRDTFLRACANLASFEPGTNMLPWVCTSLRNLFYSECRPRRALEPIDVVAEQIAVPLTQMARVEHEVLCADIGAQLPFHRREALISIGISALSYQDTAKPSGCPEGTIKSRVNRARAELAQWLAIDPVMTAAGASSALP